MDLVQLYIKGISYSQTQTGAYALILEEPFSHKKIPVIIGAYEAQAIAIAIEKDIMPPRPLTHDLFLQMGQLFGYKLQKIVISKLEDGIFFSDMFFQFQHQIHTLDARTSDACALAVRFNAPIFTTVDILQKAGIYFDQEEIPSEIEHKPELDQTLNDSIEQLLEIEANNPYKNVTDKELQEMLENAVQREDYEVARKIKDELDQRNQKNI